MTEKQTYGIYAEPIKTTGDFKTDMMRLFDGYSDKFKATEYCTTEYSKENVKLIKYSENIWAQWNPVEQQELKWKF